MEIQLETIMDFPLFAGIAEADLPAMLQCLGYRVERYRKGEFLAIEGEPIQQIGVILQGRVDMLKEDFWGHKMILMRMQKSDVFGEAFTFGSNAAATVSFRAADDTVVLLLPLQRVLHTCNRTCAFHHRLVENMVQLLANKNQELMKKVEVVTKKTLREKIFAYLSQQAQQQGKAYFEIPLGRTELADYLCADRSALTRELSNMKKDGLLDYDKNMFRFL